jgi:hypothetical protein
MMVRLKAHEINLLGILFKTYFHYHYIFVFEVRRFKVFGRLVPERTHPARPGESAPQRRAILS